MSAGGSDGLAGSVRLRVTLLAAGLFAVTLVGVAFCC